jgi:hypothetical protein
MHFMPIFKLEKYILRAYIGWDLQYVSKLGMKFWYSGKIPEFLLIDFF